MFYIICHLNIILILKYEVSIWFQFGSLEKSSISEKLNNSISQNQTWETTKKYEVGFLHLGTLQIEKYSIVRI